MLRKVLILSLVVFLVCALATTASAAKAKLVFWTMWAGDAHLEVQRGWAEDFAKENPDAEVTVEVVPWGEYYEKYLAAIAGKTPPDLGVLPPETAVQFGAAGWMEAVEDALEEFGIDNIYESLVALHTYKGHTWAAPHVNYCQVLFVREDFLEETGWTVPSEEAQAWTWDEMRQIAEKMTEDTDGDGEIDKWGIGGEIVTLNRSHGTEHAVAMAMKRHGVTYRDLEGNITFDTPETVEAVQGITDLFLKYKVMPPGSPGYGPEFTMLYETNKIGIFGASSSNYFTFQNESPEAFEKTILLPYPTGPMGGSNWISPDGIGVFKGTKDVKWAKEFVKFYLRDDNIRKWAKATGGLCATKSGNEDPHFQETLFKVQSDQIGWGWATRTNGLMVTPSDGEIIGMYVYQDLIQDIVSKGMSVEDAVKKATETMKKLPSIRQKL